MSIYFGDHSPENRILIAGPCAAESYEQITEVSLAIGLLIHAMRASLFKPRTNPGFEGVGIEVGTPWLIEAAKHNEIAIATEVISPQEVDKLIKLIDGSCQLIVWLGSRAQVQTLQRDIARAVKNAPPDTLLIAKNQPWGDKKHWIGITNYIAQGTNFSEEEMKQRVALCHRGFHPYRIDNPNGYRNIPDLDMMAQVREETGLRMILDPSHIGGTREKVTKFLLEALASHGEAIDGLLIEVHPNPSQALTDAAQQFSPQEFKQLLAELKRMKAIS